MSRLNKHLPLSFALILAAAGLAACGLLPGFGPTPFPTSPVPLSETQLKYRLIDALGEVFFCDPDFYPIAREDEANLAVERFSEIQADLEEFHAILARLGLTGQAIFSTDDKLAIYREHKRLAAILLEPAGASFRFSMRAIESEVITALEGEIDRFGAIRVTTRTPSSDMCPICLAESARIDSPDGQIAIRDLRPGDMVWTLTRDGQRVARPVLFVAVNPAPRGHTMLRLTLSDGRSLLASPGHPTPSGSLLADLRAGDLFAGAAIVSLEAVPYRGLFTYDLLPASDTGFYWADGVLMASTLAGDSEQ